MMMSNEDNGNVCTNNGTILLKPTSSSTEDLSEYTDADESISAPTEFLAEFLSAVMLKDYETALKYCKLILQYEPNNVTAKDFYPLIVEKLNNISNNKNGSEDEESSSNQGEEEEESSGDGDSSDSEESGDEDGEEEENNSDPVDKRSSSDGDATTASYSSLEDEEAETDQLNNLAAKFRVDNVNLGNGNKIICDSSGSKLWQVKSDDNSSNIMPVPLIGTSSDSESPTEPVSQQTIAMLRAKVLPPKH